MKKYTVVLDLDNDLEWSGPLPREIWYNEEGRIERLNGPAKTISETDTFEKILQQEWYRDGVLHREGAPAIVKYADDGSVMKEEWFHRGERHREGAPAVYEVDKNTGWVLLEGWYEDGLLHREGAPANIYREFESGVVYIETWSQRGRLHRVDGPANILRDENDGTIECEDYYVNGRKIEPLDRDNEPAPGM